MSDAQINRKICAPNFKRAVLIIWQSINHSNYSIIKMAEIYDFNSYERLIEGFSFFASSDGSSPSARSMCHVFNTSNKTTLRIVPHADGPRPEKNFDYNFLMLLIYWIIHCSNSSGMMFAFPYTLR